MFGCAHREDEALSAGLCWVQLPQPCQGDTPTPLSCKLQHRQDSHSVAAMPELHDTVVIAQRISVTLLICISHSCCSLVSVVPQCCVSVSCSTNTAAAQTLCELHGIVESQMGDQLPPAYLCQLQLPECERRAVPQCYLSVSCSAHTATDGRPITML